MKYSFLLGFCALTLSYASRADYEEEDGVIILDEGNFETAVKEFPFLMIQFYAPWCDHCQKLAPEYSSAAAQVKDMNIVFAKIEAEKALNISSNQMIQGYPTIKLFRDGRSKVYDGKRLAYEIVNWLHVNAVPLVTIIQDQNELEVFKKLQTTVLMYITGLDETIQQQNMFAFMADQCEGIFFGLTRNQDLRAQMQLDEEDKIILYSPHKAEPIIMHGEISLENIWYFVQNNSYPTISTYNAREKLFIEEMENPAIYLFLDGVENNIPEEQAFSKVAHKLKGQIFFVRISKSEDDGREAWISCKFYDKFGINEFPSIYIQDTRGIRPFKKYRFEGEINENTISKFINDFKESKLKPFYKSQQLPIQRTVVRDVVGLTFQEDVLDSDKDVLVLFYSQHDTQSRKFQLIYETLAQKLKEVNPNIVLTKINAPENQIPDYNIEKFPTLKLFKKIGYSKDEIESLDYSGERTFEDILEFLEENTSFQWIDLVSQPKSIEVESSDL